MCRFCPRARKWSMARLRAIAISQGHRTGQGGIKSSGLTPSHHEDLLQHILGLAAIAQDTVSADLLEHLVGAGEQR
jgi:hypothetical protein